MSTEYDVSLQLASDSSEAASALAFFQQVLARRPPFELEDTFERHWPAAEAAFSGLLDHYAPLFLTLVAVVPAPQHFTLHWQGYGQGELFLDEMIALTSAMGLQVIEGRAQGDEEVYVCELIDGQLDCGYYDVAS